jgi:hypothetical protein
MEQIIIRKTYLVVRPMTIIEVAVISTLTGMLTRELVQIANEKFRERNQQRELQQENKEEVEQ